MGIDSIVIEKLGFVLKVVFCRLNYNFGKYCATLVCKTKAKVSTNFIAKRQPKYQTKWHFVKINYSRAEHVPFTTSILEQTFHTQ